MVEVAVGYDDEVDFAIANEVEIRHRLRAGKLRMKAGINDEGVFADQLTVEAEIDSDGNIPLYARLLVRELEL